MTETTAVRKQNAASLLATTGRRRTPKHNQQGALLHEAALVLPLVLFVVLVTIQYGMVLCAEITLKNASAVAARAAILDGLDPNQVDALARQAVLPILKNDATSLQVTVSNTNINSTAAKIVALTYQYRLFVPSLVVGSSGGRSTA